MIKETFAMTSLLTRAAAVLATTLACAFAPTTHAASAGDALALLDKTTLNGRLDAVVDVYAPPEKDGQSGKHERYPAQLAFERPDRFRISIRPGEKNEYRAVAEAGIVRWLDFATGWSGKTEVDRVTDPLALALLGTAGELQRHAEVKDLPQTKGSTLVGARLSPRVLVGDLSDGLVWIGDDGAPIGFEFRFVDGGKVFVSVLRLQRNLQLPPEEFAL